MSWVAENPAVLSDPGLRVVPAGLLRPGQRVVLLRSGTGHTTVGAGKTGHSAGSHDGPAQ